MAILHECLSWDRHVMTVCSSFRTKLFGNLQVMANFLIKFPNFRYRGKRRSCKQSLADAIKLADPENPLLRATILAVSCTS